MTLDPAWLELICTPGIGPKRAQCLVQYFGSAELAGQASNSQWRKAGLPESVIKNRSRVDQETLQKTKNWLAQPHQHLLTARHPHASPLLDDIDDAPPWLYAIGDAELLTRPAIAIVGSRNPTPAGLEHAYDFAAELARAGFVIVSGLARGIDGAAHQGALSVDGMTIAVCATGLDRVYPAKHKQLAQRIAKQGLLISEFGLGTQPSRGNFPRRNRIIAGLSQGTLVIEAARASGSLITARMAMDFGREVLAMPGSVNNPLARGCHQLIRQGAKLVESAQDVFEEIAPSLPNPQANQPTLEQPAPEKPATEADSLLLDALGYAPTRIDELVERTGWTAEAISSQLLILELEGKVTSAPGGRYTRTG